MLTTLQLTAIQPPYYWTSDSMLNAGEVACICDIFWAAASLWVAVDFFLSLEGFTKGDRLYLRLFFPQTCDGDPTTEELCCEWSVAFPALQRAPTYLVW